MKTLFILRHAKSSHDDPRLHDHDRPLAKRGRKATKKMARLLDQEGLWPDLILCSTAERAEQTAKRVINASDGGFQGRIRFVGDLYAFDAGSYVEVLRELKDGPDRVMIVGHNPGLESLIHFLSGEWHRFPTAALARLELDIDDWPRLDHDTGRVSGLWLPRELSV